MPLPVTRGALVQPLARRWYRGPAKVVGDLIVMDGRRAQAYEPMLTVGEIGIALVRVRTPDDVVSFVARFGLLAGPHAEEPCPARVEQPLVEFEQAAANLRQILQTILDVQKAAAGDAPRMARLRESFGPVRPDAIVTVRTALGVYRRSAQEWLTVELPPDPVLLYTPESVRRSMAPKTDAEILIEASNWATMGLSNGLIEAHPYVFDAAQLFPDDGHTPGTVRLGILAGNLLGFCYLSVAQQLERRADGPIEWCPECGRVFVITDGRQRFCEPACASRARWKTFKKKNAGRARHGKTTRKG